MVKEVQVPVIKVVDIPEIKRVKKSIKVDKIVKKQIQVIKEVEVPVVRTTVREVEVPVYVDKIVKKSVIKYEDEEHIVNVEKHIDVVNEVEEVVV